MKRALVLGRVPLEQGGEAILLCVRDDAFVELADGPHPGVTILAPEARRLAETILRLVEEMESGRPPADGFDGFGK